LFILRVHPVPAPFSIIAENINSNKLGTNSQKLILFNLGKAISGPPTNKGNKKLPNPPINAGIHLSHKFSQRGGLFLYLLI
jgi:hypothetical protein